MRVTALVLLALLAACDEKSPGTSTVPAQVAVLEARAVPAGPRVDGRMDGVWSKAKELTLRLDGDVAEVKLKALHDGERLYLLAIWQDPQRSMNRYWIDRGGIEFDLSRTEDAFSIAWAPGSKADAFKTAGCAMTCHDGKHALPGDGHSLFDFWKYGAQTTAKYPQAIDMVLPEGSAGRLRGDKQPAGSGNILNHSAEFKGPGYYPYWIRKGVQRILTHDNARPITRKQKLEKLSDKRNVGREIPYDVLRPRKGSRGDVRAIGRHHEGKAWVLEISRAFDTGQTDDLTFGDVLVPAYFAVAIHNDTEGAGHATSGPVELRFLSAK